MSETSFGLLYQKQKLWLGFVESSTKSISNLIVTPLEKPISKHAIKIHPKSFLFQFTLCTSDPWKTLTEIHALLMGKEMDDCKAMVTQLVQSDKIKPEKKYKFEQFLQFLDWEQVDQVKKLVLFVALEQCKWLQRRKDEYIKMTKEQMDQKEWTAELRRFSLQPMGEFSDETKKKIAEQLKSVLIKGHLSEYWKTIAAAWTLKKTTVSFEAKLMNWLNTALGQKFTWTDLYLQRGDVEKEFPKEVETNAREIIQNAVNKMQKQKRKEWKTGFTFTIDASTTKDFDDAITVLDFDSNGITLAVHISDIGSFVDRNSRVFLESENRVTSVYLVGNQVYPMMPTCLSEEYFSLVSGKLRPVVSYEFQLGKEGSIKILGITRGLITVQENMSYEKSEQLIESGKDFWNILYRCCDAIYKKRLADGALSFEGKGIRLDISDENNVQLKLVAELPQRSTLIIRELSILSSFAMAEFFKTNKIPGLYSVQPPYTIINKKKSTPLSTQDVIFSEHGGLSTTPGINSIFGKNHYKIQCTSPLRKFLDLVMQMQLSHYLETGKALFTEQELSNWSKYITNTTAVKQNVEQQVIRHWMTVYLNQHCIGKKFAAIPKGVTGTRQYKLFIPDLNYIINASCNERIDKNQLIIKIDSVDIDLHEINISII